MWDKVIYTKEEYMRSFKAANDILLSYGITSMHDGSFYGEETIGLYQEACEKGLIKVRMYNLLYHAYGKTKTIEWINKFIATGIKGGLGNEAFRLGHVKILIDVSTSGPSCATTKPYSHNPHLKGIQLYTQEESDDIIIKAHNAGFNVLITANNHSLDRGRKGLERTIQLIDSLKIPHAGTYLNAEERENKYPLLLEKKGFRIAILNYTYGTNGIPVTPPNIVNYIDTTIISKDIEASKTLNPDAIIACMHWGIEYQSLPDKEQKFLTYWLLQKGVNHIIGCHPHVVQPIEVREDSLTNEKHLVVYSLGNYISNMSARRTDGGLMVKMELVKDSTTRLNHCEYSLVWTARPVQSKKKNHQLLPINFPTDSISVNARNSLRIFANDARALFNKHNRGIKEYLFYKKK